MLHIFTLKALQCCFCVCAEEFRECISGLCREHKCALHLKQGLLSLSFSSLWGRIFSAGVSSLVWVVETGFPTCYWDSDLRSLDTVHTIPRKCRFLSAWSLWTDRWVSWNMQGISTKENMHPFPLGWLLILLVFFAVVCGMSSEVLAMYRGLCTCAFLTYNFKPISRQSRYLDLLRFGPVSCWCLWTHHANSYFL